MQRGSYSFVLRRTCLVGAMVAIAILLCRLLGYPAYGAWRVEISFLPIYVVALLYGPLWAGAAWGAADLIGAAITTGIDPFITLIKVMCGVLFGLFFRGKGRVGFLRIFLCTTLVAVLLDFLAMMVVFHYQFGYTWEAACTFRLISAGVNLPVRIVILWLADRRLAGLLIKQKGRIDGTL